MPQMTSLYGESVHVYGTKLLADWIAGISWCHAVIHSYNYVDEQSHTITHHKELQMDSQTGTKRVLTLQK